MDGRDKRLAFFGMNGRIKIKYCVCCAYEFDFNFCKYTEDEESTFIGREFDGKPWRHRIEPKWEDAARDENLNRHGSFNTAYAVCPECKKRMMHIAQLGEEYTETGTDYIQICTDCKIAAVTYQQT